MAHFTEGKPDFHISAGIAGEADGRGGASCGWVSCPGSISGVELAPPQRVAGEALVPSPLVEDTLCAGLWAWFLPSRNSWQVGLDAMTYASAEVCKGGASNPERIPRGGDASA